MIRREIVFPVTREELWDALTEPERLEDWFANEVEVDLRPGGAAHFRWSNGEERHATVTTVAPEERLAFSWDDEGEVEFTLADDADGTRLTVVETAPAWSTALDLQASAFAHVGA
ncbi:MAG TPA: SRPBCC domain-containing protein [Gaiellaceae bacterium]|nr:SRPBCC domain-containing protein [Gaiellaceae bacterium]